jgi:transposase-like protein
MEELQVEQTRQQFTEEFRRMAVARMKSCGSVVGLARELGVRAKLLHRWRARLEGRTKLAVPRQLTLEEENRQLKQLLAERTLEVDFFKGALQKIAARRQADGGTGGTASTTKCGQ